MDSENDKKIYSNSRWPDANCIALDLSKERKPKSLFSIHKLFLQGGIAMLIYKSSYP